ncbi:MAG: tetratricopeptide repeat protein [Deltaproteobacteria bacterium]|nr:tetratricopeptide repeat protein [Deltaproteobacteria bacterium]
MLNRLIICLLTLSLALLILLDNNCQAQSNTERLDLISAVESGYLAQRRGDYELAIEIYTSIIKRRGLLPKQRAVSYLLRGEAKRDNGQLEEAIYDFTRALNQWENYPQAIFFRGQVLVQLNRLPEALIDFTRAVELDPNRESYNTSLSLLKKRMQAEGLPIEVQDTTLQITIPQEH